MTVSKLAVMEVKSLLLFRLKVSSEETWKPSSFSRPVLEIIRELISEIPVVNVSVLNSGIETKLIDPTVARAAKERVSRAVQA